MHPSKPSPDSRLMPANPLPAVPDPATPAPEQGQTPAHNQPAVPADAQPLVNSTAPQPLPEGWPLPATTQQVRVAAPAETHGEPRLHASAAATAPAGQAAQAELPFPDTINLNLSFVWGDRHKAIQQALAAHPTATGIAVKSATLDDLQCLSREASHYPGLRHVSVELAEEKRGEGYESAIASALARIPALASVDIDTKSDAACMDTLLGTLAKSCSSTLESVVLRSGEYTKFGILMAFANLHNHQPKLQSLVLDVLEANEDGAAQSLIGGVARLPSLKHLTLGYITSEQTAEWLTPLLMYNTSLESLDAALSFPDPTAAKSVGDALAANRSLRRLKFDNINFFREDKEPYANGDGRELGDKDIENAGDHLGPPLYQALAEGLAKNQTLESVYFAFDVINGSDRAVRETAQDIGLFITAIGRHPRITEATLEIWEEANFNHLLQLLENSPHLQRLTLIGWPCSPQQYEQLALAIEKHPSLVEFNMPTSRADNSEFMEDLVQNRWMIPDPVAVFERLQSRINTALTENHGKQLGRALTGMMELRELEPDMLPTPPQEINKLIMMQGLASLSDADRENLIKAFKL